MGFLEAAGLQQGQHQVLKRGNRVVGVVRKELLEGRDALVDAAEGPKRLRARSPVHFGVVVVMNMMIGILTPPMGVSLFVVAKVGNVPFGTLARAIIPFIIPLFIVLLLLIFFPPLVMFLPSLM